MEKTNYSRFVATKTIIKDVLEGTYVQENEQNSNYLLTKSQVKLFRVNIIAIILEVEKQGAITNLLVEDGTGKIILRSFEEDPSLTDLKAGDIILCIAKPRIYNQEQYLSPEIIKKTSSLWLKLRAAELKHFQQMNPLKEATPPDKNKPKEEQIIMEEKELAVENVETVEKNFKEDKNEGNVEVLPVQKILKLIKEIDSGDGADMTEIIEKSHVTDTEKLLEKMLEKGDIFQISPGKVKVL